MAPHRRSLDAVLGLCAAASATVLVIALVVATLAFVGLDRDRRALVERYDPALLAAQQLRVALVDQQNGLRGYGLDADPAFLEPYRRGLAQEQALTARLRELLVADPAAGADQERVSAEAQQWRTGYAEPVLASIRARAPDPDPRPGRIAFDEVRAALQVQEDRLVVLRGEAGAGVDDAAHRLAVVGVLIAVALALGLALLLRGLRRGVVRPTRRLADEVRHVAEGELHRPVAVTGPKEIAELGADVDAMRRALLAELARTEAARTELERSNADLEQFAYVASHDLQEPLRKVASFCQLLQRRYDGQLDERADRYIEFAVDGAKRMQVLINDLLAFSRVARATGVAEVVDTGALLDRAVENLGGALEESGGTVTRGTLPTVSAEPALLTTVFQNLVGNSLKFRGDDPPRVHVDAERDGDRWLLRFRDNGIGIEPEYAERIFAIFQRLHGKGDYPGTGIGLAMCRRIVEHHDGTVALEPSDGAGSTFVVALPALPDPDSAAGTAADTEHQEPARVPG